MSKIISKKRIKSESKINFQKNENSIIKNGLDKEYIEHCVRLSQERKYMISGEKEKNKMLKRCQKCKDFKNEKSILFCIYCQDAYHSYCLKPKIKNIPRNKECIKCPRCIEQQKTNYKQLRISDIFSDRKNSTSPLPKGYQKINEDDNKIEITKKSKCFKCNKNLDNNIDYLFLYFYDFY